MSFRYQVKADPADHFQGCDRWLILDTSREQWGRPYQLAECYSMEDAELVCDALNRAQVVSE